MKNVVQLFVKRFANYGTLVSVAAFVLQQLLDAGVITLAQFDQYGAWINGVLYALVLLGILNNPDKGKFYLDK